MKTRTVLPALTISMALVATSGFAQGNQQNQTQQSGNSGQIQRITQESLEQKVTAKDLIGSTVYDQNGDNIGDIADVSVKRLVPNKLTKALRQNQEGMASTNSDWMTDNDQGQDSEQGEGWGESKKDKMQSSMKGMMGSGATVFISVGGLFGIGDDIVAVPASKLSYNEEEDRFTINASKDQIVALAEQEAVEYDSEQEDFAAWEQNEQEDFSARQEFDSDSQQSGTQSEQGVNKVREALRNDSQLEDNTGIMVSTEQDQIVLRGVVSSEDAKNRAEEIAKKNSDKDVKNEIRVQKNN